MRLRAALADTRRLPPPAYTEAQWQVLEAITELLKRAVGQLKLVFQSRGQVDFTEVSQRALLALEDSEGPTDLALRLDYQIRHLLIDEFQDTSISQFELLARLTAGWTPDDGRTLFAVGDPMQSIYRFREAEVGLFLRARAEGIGNVVLTPLELSANFRSQAGIVAWVNEAFAQVMPEREDIASGAVAYTASQAVHPRLDGDAVADPSAVRRRRERSEAEEVAQLVAGIAAAERAATDTQRPSIADPRARAQSPARDRAAAETGGPRVPRDRNRPPRRPARGAGPARADARARASRRPPRLARAAARALVRPHARRPARARRHRYQRRRRRRHSLAPLAGRGRG